MKKLKDRRKLLDFKNFNRCPCFGNPKSNEYDPKLCEICRKSDIFDNVDNKEGFDVIIFNPPYVTTDDDEYQRALKDKDIYASWAGGKKGSETIFKFLDQLKNNIKQNGILYLLLSKENEYHTIISRIKNECGFDFDVLMKKRAKNERLAVFKFYKK